jgi:hypothetical protein
MLGRSPASVEHRVLNGRELDLIVRKSMKR